MALDSTGLGMIAPLIKGAEILCLGYPDITVPRAEVKKLLGVEPMIMTDHGRDHKVDFRLPETVSTLKLAGAALVDCVDSMPTRGMERVVDLNVRQAWPRRYGLVINPGTIEHCFDVAAATFNAWRALKLGGFALHVAPLSMVNHGFWNICPTAIVDFVVANGGTVIAMRGVSRSKEKLQVLAWERFRVPPESVMYALVRKDADTEERVPTQRRFRA